MAGTETCLHCERPIHGLRVVVLVCGFWIGPYCSVECAPAPSPVEPVDNATTAGEES